MGLGHTDFVDSPMKLVLLCHVCNEVLKDPVAYPCDHYACNACVAAEIRKGNRTCTACDMHGAVNNAPRIVKQMIRLLMVKCFFSADGCDQVMTLSNQDSHAMVCPFRPEICSYCPTVALPRDIAVHELFCQANPWRSTVADTCCGGCQDKLLLTNAEPENEG